MTNATPIRVEKTYDMRWKRGARIVRLSRGWAVRFYLRGRIWDSRPATPANVAKAALWVEKGLCSELFKDSV